jgi:hypothetical protein
LTSGVVVTGLPFFLCVRVISINWGILSNSLSPLSNIAILSFTVVFFIRSFPAPDTFTSIFSPFVIPLVGKS